MMCFFTNQANKTSNTHLARPKPSATKRPHTTYAEELFAKDHGAELQDTIKNLRDGSASSPRKEENLTLYRVARSEAFSKLSASKKQKWETLASEHNERKKNLPPMEHIFE
jgi:hypothetical protein